MLKTQPFFPFIADAGWYEFHRQVVYKTALTGNNIFLEDRWCASSKRCSGCEQVKKELPLSDPIVVSIAN